MKVKNIGTVITGKTPATSNDRYYSSDDYMFVTPEDILDDTYIINRTKRYISCVGLESIRTNSVNGISIAVTCIGEIGRCAILNGTCATNQQINSITDIDTNLVNPIALYYWFKLCGKQLINYASQTVMPIVSKSTFENIELELPDINHQNVLADLLSHIDNLIINNNRINNLCKDFVRMIYDYWFVQFDFPDENGRPYKSSGGKMVYNDQLKKEIPEGWKVIKYSDIAKTVTGKHDANFATTDGNYAYFTCSADVLRCNDYAFDGKAILIAGNGNFNVRYYSGKFNAYQRTYVLMPPEKYIGILYMECLRKADSFKKGGNGSIIKFITKSDIDNIYITVPPQDKILQPFNMCLDLMQLLNDESSILAKLRDWLLPMLMNGQVEIKE